MSGKSKLIIGLLLVYALLIGYVAALAWSMLL